MAKKDFTTPLTLNGDYPNLDDRYTYNGNPYTSVSAAQTVLASKMNAYYIGLTVLVKESGWTEAKEYWVQPYDDGGNTLYHFVEKGAGTTDYNDLENKPSIGDGENPALELAGTVEVEAQTAADTNPGVQITPRAGGGVSMKFSLPKGADGKSAYGVWLEEHGYAAGQHPVSEFLESLKGSNGDNASLAEFRNIAYDNAANALPVGGTAASVGSVSASQDTAGVVLLMPDSASNPTDIKIFTTVESDGDYLWMYAGTFGSMTFYDLAERLSAIEEKMPVRLVNIKSRCNPQYGKGVNGVDGTIGTAGEKNSASEVEVAGADRVRFLGTLINWTPTSGGGYAFGHYENGTWVTDLACLHDYDTSLPEVTTKTYDVAVPEGATHFRVISSYYTDLFTFADFFVYLVYGSSLATEQYVDDKLSKAGYHYEVLNIKSRCNPQYGKGVDGETGEIAGAGAQNSASEVEVAGADRVRFLGVFYKSKPAAGYAFGHYENGTWSLDFASPMDYDASLSEVTTKTYDVAVPEGATHFRVNSSYYNTDLFTFADFFVYLVYGSSLSTEQYVKDKFAMATPAARQEDRVRQILQGFEKNSSFVLLHFSDIHSDRTELQRIVDFKRRYQSMIADAIHTGDSVHQKAGDGMGFWNKVNGAENILNVLGNHDVSKQNYGADTGMTVAECYGQYFEPYIGNWGVVPGGTGVCYYYKDYSGHDIRLIVLDLYHGADKTHLDTAQLSWLESVLEDARVNNKHVIVAGHCPESPFQSKMDTSFDSLLWDEGTEHTRYNAVLGQDAISAMAAFVSNGGNFVCYICGHWHDDMFRKFNGHDNMLSITIANASVLQHLPAATINLNLGPNCTYPRVIGEKSEDLFNLLAVDTSHSLLTLVRVGQDTDNFGRHIGGVTYDYANNRIVGQW